MNYGKAMLAIALLSLVCLTPAKAQNSNATTETRDLAGNSNPERVTETQTERNGRTIKTRLVEAPNINGGYTLVSATEEETVHENANTVRVVQRSFVADANGSRQLSQVTEAETTTLPTGAEKTTRTTSQADGNGGLQPVRREIEQSTPVNATTKETVTTVLVPSGNGFSRVQETRQIEEQKDGGVTDVKRTSRATDLNGNLVTFEVKQSVEKRSANGERIKDESVLRQDPGRAAGDAAVSPIQRTIVKEWKDSQGQEHSATQTYSTYLPGAASDGGLHLDRQVVTVRSFTADGAKTVQQVEERNSVAPADGLRPSETVTESSRRGSGGQVQTQRTVSVPASNGGMKPVVVTDSNGSRQVR